MDERVFALQANVCKVFSHPKRLEILCLLKDGEKSFSELQTATGLSKANLPQQVARPEPRASRACSPQAAARRTGD